MRTVNNYRHPNDIPDDEKLSCGEMCHCLNVRFVESGITPEKLDNMYTFLLKELTYSDDGFTADEVATLWNYMIDTAKGDCENDL